MAERIEYEGFVLVARKFHEDFGGEPYEYDIIDSQTRTWWGAIREDDETMDWIVYDDLARPVLEREYSTAEQALVAFVDEEVL